MIYNVFRTQRLITIFFIYSVTWQQDEMGLLKIVGNKILVSHIKQNTNISITVDHMAGKSVMLKTVSVACIQHWVTWGYAHKKQSQIFKNISIPEARICLYECLAYSYSSTVPSTHFWQLSIHIVHTNCNVQIYIDAHLEACELMSNKEGKWKGRVSARTCYEGTHGGQIYSSTHSQSQHLMEVSGQPCALAALH